MSGKRGKRHTRYTIEEKKAVVAYAEEYSIREAGKKFGIPASAIYPWFHTFSDKKLLIKSRLPGSALIDAVVENPFLTVRQAAQMFGVCEQTVRNAAKEAGIVLNRRHFSRTDVDRVVAFLNDHPKITLDDAAKELGISRVILGIILKHVGFSRPSITGQDEILDEKNVREYVKNHPDATLRELGEAFDVSRQTVLNFLRRHKIPYKNKNPLQGEKKSKERQAILDKVGEVFKANKGIPMAVAARIAGVPVHYAVRYAKENGVRPFRMRPSISKEELIWALAEFSNHAAIGKHYGVHESTVGRLVCRYGLQSWTRNYANRSNSEE